MAEQEADCSDSTIVSALLIEIGIRPSLQGYDYLKEAVLIYKKHNGVMKNITKEIAEKDKVSLFKVEKAMRSALNHVQDQGELNRLNAILKTDYIRPNVTISTKEFLALISEYINNDYFRNEILRKTLKNL